MHIISLILNFVATLIMVLIPLAMAVFIAIIIAYGIYCSKYEQDNDEYERENKVFDDDPVFTPFIRFNKRDYPYNNREQRRADKGRRINSREDRYNYNAVDSVMKFKHINNNVNLNISATRGKKQKHSHKIRSNA